MKQDNRTEKRRIGDTGEDIACKFLVKRGFEIIEQNYNKKWGEIDIIARKGQKLHFVEVKTVSHLPYIRVKSDGSGYENDYYRPEDNLHPWKLKRLSRVIQTYLLNCKNNPNWQFDVITVYLDLESMEAKVDYLEDIIL